jgi:hypothetical protein
MQKHLAVDSKPFRHAIYRESLTDNKHWVASGQIYFCRLDGIITHSLRRLRHALLRRTFSS